MIGKLLFGAGVALAVGYCYPLWNESARDPCQAVEQRFIGMATTPAPLSHPGRALEWAVLRSYIEPFSDGRIAAAQAKQRYPALPPQLGCAVGYWTALLDPHVEAAIRQRLR